MWPLALLAAAALAGSATLPPLGTLPIGQSPDGSKDVALVIAIEDYLALDDVPGARINGEEWVSYLERRGVPPEHIAFLTREDAIAANVPLIAKKLAALRGTGGRVWFVFVGHGTAVSGRSGLVGYNAVLTNVSMDDDSVTPDEVVRWLTGGRADVPVFAVIDACFAGGVKIPGSMTALPPKLSLEAADTMLLAAKADQVAGPLPGLRRPAFSWLALAALRGWGDGDGDGAVTGAEVVRFTGGVLGQVLTDHHQDPELQGKGDAILARGREPRPDVVAMLTAMVPTCEAAARGAAEREVQRRLATEVNRLQSQVRAEWQGEAVRYAGCGAVQSATARGQCVEELRTWIADTKGLAAVVPAARWTVPASAGCGPREVDLPQQRQALVLPEVAAAETVLAALTKPVDEKWMVHPVLGRLRRIPEGTYQMGSKVETNEQPVHTVTLSSFWIMESEVTQKMYRTVTKKNPSGFADCDDCPVENLSWDEAVAFAKAVSTPELQFRLPTEAEWEYAARGGEAHTYAGSNEAGEVAWTSDNAGGRTQAVCQLKRNGFDLCDMSGNVWEWVSDWYAAYPSAAQTNPRGGTGSFRVLRGGCWYGSPANARVALRFYYTPDNRYSLLGFRLARSSP